MFFADKRLQFPVRVNKPSPVFARALQQAIGAYFVHDVANTIPEGRWTHGPSIDGKGEFSAMMSTPMGEIPMLAPARPDGFAQRGQMSSDPATAAQMSAGQKTGLPPGSAVVL